MKMTVTRVAIPAHIYIAVETPETFDEHQIIEAAKARIAQVDNGDCIFLKGFQGDEHAVVYVNHELPASIEDVDW